MNEEIERKVAIDEKVISRTMEEINNFLKQNQDKIADVFLENQIIDIFLKVRYKTDNEKLKIKTQITFVTERVKDSTEIAIDFDQLQLFED
ncbi:hypothetical protein KAR91_29075 [Candidatus Pacearchaeota archaeon]|nr:hypothetical protein [Candidatus Pacearchaeota archaeon]